MTKVSVFGQETEKKKGKPIEFKLGINHNGSFDESPRKPSYYKEVILIQKGYNGFMDLIIAKSEKDIFSFLGHWNDGFVE